MGASPLSCQAAGRTGLTTTLLVGFAQFGRWARHELYYLVAGIWIFQLLASPLWLRRFHFGPFEWLWRSLTYLQRQPFRRQSIARSSSSALPRRAHHQPPTLKPIPP